MKLQNKILLILIIAFSFILFFNISTVKANVSYDLSGINYINNSNYVIFKASDGFYYLIVSNNPSAVPLYINKSSDQNYKKILLCENYNTNSIRNSYLYKFNDNGSYTFVVQYGYSDIPYTVSEIIYSKSDVKNFTDNSIFFHQTPLTTFPIFQLLEIPAGTIAPLLEAEEMEKANLQIRVIIPLILVVVVSFLGLRKALKMLSQILHRS